MATIAHEGVATRTNAVATATVATDGAARAARYVFAGVRIAIGTIFLWAFLDKTFGLGHATASKAAWLNGGHPTNGFLKGAVSGPFKGFYNGLAGSTFLDWLFMLGLLGLGVALISGVGIRVAAVAGSVLLVLMWSAVLPPANHVFMDDHLIYAGTLVGLALTNAGNTVGLGRRWGNTALVRKSPWLK
jgi:thiosulfate dehydrogenase [quinone] large subunit